MLSLFFLCFQIAYSVQIDVILFYNKNVISLKLQIAQKVSYCSHGEVCEQFRMVFRLKGKKDGHFLACTHACASSSA